MNLQDGIWSTLPLCCFAPLPPFSFLTVGSGVPSLTIVCSDLRREGAAYVFSLEIVETPCLGCQYLPGLTCAHLLIGLSVTEDARHRIASLRLRQ